MEILIKIAGKSGNFKRLPLPVFRFLSWKTAILIKNGNQNGNIAEKTGKNAGRKTAIKRQFADFIYAK